MTTSSHTSFLIRSCLVFAPAHACVGRCVHHALSLCACVRLRMCMCACVDRTTVSRRIADVSTPDACRRVGLASLCMAAMASSSNAVGGAREHASGAVGGATEHASGMIATASDPQKMTLEDAIVTLEAHGDLDDRGTNIFAAATTLRDSTGRIERLVGRPDRTITRQWTS